MKVPLGTSDYVRAVAQQPSIRTKNRYFEFNPTNQEGQMSLLARPALRRWLPVGSGPIRAIYSQNGSFNNALFVVSESILYRVDTDETITTIQTGINGITSFVSMAATPDYLFIADGRILYVYTDNGFALGTLTASGAIVNNDTVKIDTTYYKWTNASVDAGTPAGTNANPWLVNLGADNTEALANLRQAVNGNGTPGTTYSTALTAHLTATAYSADSTTMKVRALSPGLAGNAISTTETGANIAWGGATLSGGGTTSCTQVAVPDDVGVVSVGFINGYVIVVVAQGYGFNGRFYWIDPGDTFIDPLNFATAERSPDPLFNVVVVGDQFWLPGPTSTEVWYTTGDPTAPMLRVQGRLFDRGTWEGAALQVKDSMIIVANDGNVYDVQGGPDPIAPPDIAERIREAIASQIRAGYFL